MTDGTRVVVSGLQGDNMEVWIKMSQQDEQEEFKNSDTGPRHQLYAKQMRGLWTDVFAVVGIGTALAEAHAHAAL